MYMGKRLIVKNFGPIKEVDIDLKKINVFIGPQGSGKSTIAKIISFCSWLDKRRSDDGVYIGAYKRLTSYHKLHDYFKDDTLIYYQGDNIIYAYGWPEGKTIPAEDFKVGNSYHVDEKELILFNIHPSVNPKVIYIPAERNFVSAVPNLQDYVEGDDSLHGFILDWYRAKNKYSISDPLGLLNLGVKFYSSGPASDYILHEGGKSLRLNASASGYQSVVPLLAVVDWLSNGIYKEAKPFSAAEEKMITELLGNLSDATDSQEMQNLKQRLKGIVEGKVYTHTQFVVEEPCQNLFPEAQRDLIYYLISSLDHGKNHRLVMTTHSPYVLASLNNLIYAHKVGQVNKEAVESIIPSYSWIDFNDINVFFVTDGGVESILDEDLKLIKAEEIDGISTVLNEEFDKLLELEG